MPNPGSHFLLHRRLLWNSGSVADVTRSKGRVAEGKGEKERPPSPFSYSLSFSSLSCLASPLLLLLSVLSTVRRNRAATGSQNCACRSVCVCVSLSGNNFFCQLFTFAGSCRLLSTRPDLSTCKNLAARSHLWSFYSTLLKDECVCRCLWLCVSLTPYSICYVVSFVLDCFFFL